MTTAEQELQSWQTPEYSNAVTIGEFFRTIKRNRIVFWTTLILVLLAGVVASLVMPKAYAAAAEVLVEGAGANGISPSPENIMGELSIAGSSYPLTTQVELLQSQTVFYRALQQSGIPEPKTLEELEALPKVFVRQKEESNIFVITIEGENRQQVTDMAKNYPSVFKAYADSFRNDAATRARDFVTNRLQEERAALAQAEQEFSNFKSQNRVVDSGTELEFRLNMLSQSESALSDAEARLASARSTSNRLRSELGGTPKVRERVNDFANRQLVIENETRLAALRTQRAALLETYLTTAPQVRELDNQIAEQEKFLADLKKQLPDTVQESNPEWDVAQRRMSEAMSELDAAESRARELRALTDQRNERLNQLANLSRQQREIERRIGTHTQSIANLNELEDRTKLRVNEIKSSVTQLNDSVFARQSRPNWLINMTIASVLALILGTVFALVRDSLQDKVNNKGEAYALSGLPLLTHIPDRSRAKHPLITNPQTNLAFESYRVLRSAVSLYAQRLDMKSLIVTSTLRREGKTVVASNLAVAYVLNEQKTILVDANLRNPALHTLFGLQAKPGLGDVLLGNATLDEVIQPTSVDNLFVVTVGTIPANATEAIGSARMKEIVEQLEARSDMVIFDAPHLAGLADAPSLASITDAALVVTHIGKPSKTEFKEAMGLLEASSPALLGMVENRVSRKDAHIGKG